MLARSRRGLDSGNEGNGDRRALEAPHGTGLLGPNESKLSDRHRRGQAWNSKKSRPPVPVRWSAWLGDWAGGPSGGAGRFCLWKMVTLQGPALGADILRHDALCLHDGE